LVVEGEWQLHQFKEIWRHTVQICRPVNRQAKAADKAALPQAEQPLMQMLATRFAQIGRAVEQQSVQARLSQPQKAALKSEFPGEPVLSREGDLTLSR
jgi:hypothetical protein